MRHSFLAMGEPVAAPHSPTRHQVQPHWAVSAANLYDW